MKQFFCKIKTIVLRKLNKNQTFLLLESQWKWIIIKNKRKSLKIKSKTGLFYFFTLHFPPPTLHSNSFWDNELKTDQCVN